MIMVHEVEARSILNKHKKRDDWFLDDYSISPYQGCSFNCIYCYTRGSKYGTHMPKELTVKINAVEKLKKQLKFRWKKRQYGYIYVGSQEPYLPIEEKYQLTRKCLEVIYQYKFPVHIGTKGTLVKKDFDILRRIDKEAVVPEDLKNDPGRGVFISFSLSTLDEELAEIFEPGAPSPEERLETMKKCHKAGFFTGVNNIPVLPFLSDSEEQLENMVERVAEYGADYIFVGGLTLFGKGPEDCKTMYYNALEKHFPELVKKYKSLYRIFFAPPNEDQERLDEITRRLCKTYGIRFRIN
jgi:DNA repair photolyase